MKDLTPVAIAAHQAADRLQEHDEMLLARGAGDALSERSLTAASDWRQSRRLVMSRVCAQPSADTFHIEPIRALLDEWLRGAVVILDPFARNSQRGTHRNDLNPETRAESHLDAAAFLDGLTVEADVVLFDPPYSPRQIAELYQQIGRIVTPEDTQNGRLYREVRVRAARLLKVEGIAISCGWTSVAFGPEFELEALLLVCHGGAHHDTIVTVQRKVQAHLPFIVR